MLKSVLIQHSLLKSASVLAPDIISACERTTARRLSYSIRESGILLQGLNSTEFSEVVDLLEKSLPGFEIPILEESCDMHLCEKIQHEQNEVIIENCIVPDNVLDSILASFGKVTSKRSFTSKGRKFCHVHFSTSEEAASMITSGKYFFTSSGQLMYSNRPLLDAKSNYHTILAKGFPYWITEQALQKEFAELNVEKWRVLDATPSNSKKKVLMYFQDLESAKKIASSFFFFNDVKVLTNSVLTGYYCYTCKRQQDGCQCKSSGSRLEIINENLPKDYSLQASTGELTEGARSGVKNLIKDSLEPLTKQLSSLEIKLESLLEKKVKPLKPIKASTKSRKISQRQTKRPENYAESASTALGLKAEQ